MATSMSESPVKLFYSYSHKDAAYRESMETSLELLKQNGLLQQWSDVEIHPGRRISPEIRKAMAESDIGVFLFSRDFIASAECRKEWHHFAKLSAEGKVLFRIPIILRPCPWQDFLGDDDVKALPADGKPVSEFDNEDNAWLQIYEGIKRVTSELQIACVTRNKSVDGTDSPRVRSRPNIWITGMTRQNRRQIDILGQDGMSVGFSIENRSDSDLYDVRVELVKLEIAFFVSRTEYSIAASSRGEESDCEWDPFEYVDLPILLEWRPYSQVSDGISTTDIPAGTSREIGLFHGDQILAANHNIWSLCQILSHDFIHRVAIRVSARMIRAITSQDYTVSREGSGDVNSIPFVIKPNYPIELVGTEKD